MSDLLRRLRHWSNGPCAEAAAEIERLTAELSAAVVMLEKAQRIGLELAAERDALNHACDARIHQCAAERDARERAEAALTQAAEWFRQYGVGHKRKGDEDKAKRNFDRMNACLAALSRTAQPEEVSGKPPDNAVG